MLSEPYEELRGFMAAYSISRQSVYHYQHLLDNEIRCRSIRQEIGMVAWREIGTAAPASISWIGDERR